ncbi:MAG: peptidylprolyl isomerase, partial [Candidatus Omnitrophota bacterium]
MKKLFTRLIPILFFGDNDTQDNTIVILETNQGSIELKLTPLIAPKACENFLGLVKK